MKRRLFHLFVFSAYPAVSAFAQLPSKDPVWPQYRGPNGDGSTAARISRPWSSNGPKSVWKEEATNGFSSVAVAEGLAVTLMTRDVEGVATEVCVAWDAASGKEKWSFPMKMAKYDGGGDSGERDNKGGDGPRSTPSINGAKVYVMGSRLNLYCLDGKTGKEVWSADLLEQYGGKNIQWQNAASPVIEGDLCIVSGGGKGQAFLGLDKKDGKPVWKSGDATITHATPTVATLLGVRQVVFFTQSGLTGVDCKDGSILWQQPFKYAVSTAASPVVWQDIVYCSAGYGVGAGAYRIKKSGSAFSSEEIWRSEGKNMNHWSTPVCKDGYLYGMFSFKDYGKGPLCCVDIRTGEEKWSKEGYGAGNVILAGGQIVALSDRGELVLVEAQPSAYKELARADVLEGKCWSTPTLSGGRLYARSTKEAIAFDLR